MSFFSPSNLFSIQERKQGRSAVVAIGVLPLFPYVPFQVEICYCFQMASMGMISWRSGEGGVLTVALWRKATEIEKDMCTMHAACHSKAKQMRKMVETWTCSAPPIDGSSVQDPWHHEFFAFCESVFIPQHRDMGSCPAKHRLVSTKPPQKGVVVSSW